MWKKIVPVAILLLAMSSAYADTEYGADYGNTQSSTSYPKVTQIEKRLYHKSYENEDIYKRLDRIENFVFHKTFSSDDLATRMDNIQDNVQISSMPGYLLNDISLLEEANFSKVFRNDSPDARLERLEYHLIGAVQDGNYKDRVYNLKSLDSQTNDARYLEANSHLYDDSYPIHTRKESNRYANASTGGYRKIFGMRTGAASSQSPIQNFFMMVAPFLFGLL